MKYLASALRGLDSLEQRVREIMAALWNNMQYSSVDYVLKYFIVKRVVLFFFKVVVIYNHLL